MNLSYCQEFNEKLRGEWFDLESRVPCTPFQTYHYQKKWIDEIGLKAGLKTFIFFVNSGDKTVAIIPLQVKSIFGIKFVEYIGSEYADYTGALIDDGYMTQLHIDHLWNYIFQILGHGAIYHFKKVPSESRIVNSGLPIFFNKILGHKCHSIDFSKKVKIKNSADTKRQIRKLKSSGKLRFYGVSGDAAMLEPVFLNLIQLKEERLSYQKKRSLFSNKSVVNFYRALLNNGGSGGVFRLHFLIYNSEIVSVSLGALYRDTFYYLVPAYRMNFMSYSWGSILIDYLFRYANKIKVRYFDMTIGDEPYKAKYSNVNIYSDDYIYSSSYIGPLYIKFILMKNAIKKIIKKYIYA